MRNIKVGDNIRKKRANWNFCDIAAKDFIKHMRRSVPFYDVSHELICYLSDFFCKNKSICYELGVSTGQLIKKLADYNAHKNDIEWIGIDKEKSMILEAKKYCYDTKNIKLLCRDIVNFNYKKSDLVVSCYCIQFVPECYRQKIFNTIYEKLNWGGAFILFEKVRAPDARFQDMMVSIYNDYKLNNGFTHDEIGNKAKALRGVLDPFSTKNNLGLLKKAGFVNIMTIMKYVCFEGFLAIK